MEISEQEQRVLSVLDRHTDLATLSSLLAAIKPFEVQKISLESTAIAFDANVFLRLASHPRSEDIIDYLRTKHLAPIILPGQAIQEFWNNQLQAVDTVAALLRKQLDAFKSTLEKVDKSFGNYVSKMEDLLAEFSAEHGHIYDESTVRKTRTFLEMLSERALIPYARRDLYCRTATLRKETKTPPGFKDEGHGDFYIWVDMLTGLLNAQATGRKFERTVLVTGDRKADWSRAGIAHPVLTAEVDALLKVPFQIWTTDQLAQEISKID